MQAPGLTKPVNILLFSILAFAALYFGRPVLVPLAIAGIFAMLLTPACNRLERWLPSWLAALASLLVLIGFAVGVIFLLSWQISDLVADLGKAEDRIAEMLTTVRDKLSGMLGIDPKRQQQMIRQQAAQGGSQAGKVVQSVLGVLFSVSVNTVLVLVYMFLFLFSRDTLKRFVLKLVSPHDKPEARKMIDDIVRMVQAYLGGLALMILSLWVLYGIGFSIVGVKNALFFAVLCGLLEIIPFVGNLTGTALTVVMVIVQGGSPLMIVGVLCTYGVIQFAQTYVLEPLVVGSRVNLNPLFTILAIVVWESVWGAAGMFLAIPLTAIIKIVCDHVAVLQPYGEVMGNRGKS